MLVFLLENVYLIKAFLKGLGPLGGLLFKMFSYCSEVFVQRSYCCYVNTVNIKNTVASYGFNVKPLYSPPPRSGALR